MFTKKVRNEGPCPENLGFWKLRYCSGSWLFEIDVLPNFQFHNSFWIIITSIERSNLIIASIILSNVIIMINYLKIILTSIREFKIKSKLNYKKKNGINHPYTSTNLEIPLACVKLCACEVLRAWSYARRKLCTREVIRVWSYARMK